ncbi:MAG TPA: GNAT family N-acetyltransferase [Streptosporangiaceae bacterium]|jgi:predicted acetyltransferase
MDVTVIPAGRESAATIGRLLQLYLYELSDYDAREIGDDGEFPYPYFTPYWEEPGRVPLLIRADGRLAGFAFIREVAPNTWEIAEFFILRMWRGRGVGAAAAHHVLNTHRGPWEIRFHPHNPPAAALWEGLASERPNVHHGTADDQTKLSFVW